MIRGLYGYMQPNFGRKRSNQHRNRNGGLDKLVQNNHVNVGADGHALPMTYDQLLQQNKNYEVLNPRDSGV